MDINSSIRNHVMVKHANSFNSACDYILRNTPINYIGLAKIYKNNSRSYLISDPYWGEHLLKNQYHLAGTEDALIMNKKQAHHLWSISSMFSLNKKTENLFRDCINNNYGNGVTLVQHSDDSVEFIHICTNSGYESPNNFLIHNIDKLWKFVLYIKEKVYTDKVLNQAYDKRYHYCLPNVMPNSLSASNEVGNKNIDIKRFFLGGDFGKTYFTKREMSCLALLYKGKTAKDIAKSIGISHRSVEKYIEVIKSKVMTSSRNDLIDLLEMNNAFKHIILSHDF